MISNIIFIRELFYVGIIALLILGLSVIFVYRYTKNMINKLHEYEINVNAKISSDIPELLDTVIDECFNQYMILNIQYQEIVYIDSDLEDKMIRDIAEMVSNRMSPALLQKLSLYYNLNSLSDIISEKIYIVVMGYTITTNQVKDNEK